MMGRRVSFKFAVVLFGLLTAMVASAAGELKKVGPAKVLFFAQGPAGMKINGQSSDLNVKDSDNKLTMTASMNTFKTGIGLRDDHLKKYMETAKYPTAKMVVDKSKIKVPEDQKTSEGTMTGTFTLHGKTKPVKFSYRAKRMGSDYAVQGKFNVDITEFGVEQPCYLGVCMKTGVDVKVEFKLRQ